MANIKEEFGYKDFVSCIERFKEDYSKEIDHNNYFNFPINPILEIERALRSPNAKNIAYFSMEFGIAPSIYNSFGLQKPMNDHNQFFEHDVFSNFWLADYLFKIRIDKMLDIPIYGGGLGVLAGDSIKSASDLDYPVVGIGILWNKGYFKQNFWYKHGQIPEELKWDPESYPGLIPLKERVTIETKEGPVRLRLWKYYVFSFDKKNCCPIILLDSNLSDNSPFFRKLTDQLYRSDDVRWKIYQRAILGIGGMKALNALGYHIERYHLNEGHAAFSIIEQYVQLKDKNLMKDYRQKFVYTCHTPVAAGHDRFNIADVVKILTDEYAQACQIFGREHPDSEQINLTHLCLNFCPKVNAVSQKHGEIMRVQFPQFASKIKAITNGVHMHTWISKSFQELFDQYVSVFGSWREVPENLSRIDQLKNNEKFRRDLFQAHQVNKRNLIKITDRWETKDDILTIGWARRIAGYKRPALIFHNIKEILRLAYDIGPFQIILSGKAHPNDDIGSAHIEEILDHIDQLNDHRKAIKVLILENYDTYFGKLLTNSVDVWLNNPLPPFEASGTSGMKAILNGVLQLSTLDGWVAEAADSDIGWIFGYRHSDKEVGSEKELRLDEDSAALYQRLEEIIKLYYQTYKKGIVNPSSLWIDKMIHCVRNGAFFNTQRMLEQYHKEMWE